MSISCVKDSHAIMNLAFGSCTREIFVQQLYKTICTFLHFFKESEQIIGGRRFFLLDEEDSLDSDTNTVPSKTRNTTACFFFLE